jgi:peptide/nickel transport system permease protein
MAVTNITLNKSSPVAPHISQLHYINKVMLSSWVTIISMVILVLFVIIAIIAPWITPYDPNQIDMKAILEKPSKDHLLGNDELGRDLLSRLIVGSRISLLVGLVSIAIAGTIGIILGLLAGYFRGWVNTIIMRFIDTLMALPPLVLMLAIAAILGGGLFNVLISIGIGMMPTYTRLMCGQILTLKQNDYVSASRSLGASNQRIMFRHLLPNAFPPLLVLITVNLGSAILAEASLSFLGIGILPPTATWGNMVNEGKQFLLNNPLMSFVPGIAILVVVLSFNMVGDALRDALDPRLRGGL